MSQKFTLDIPKACEKGKNDWNISQKTNKGIFCSHCQTEVIDFSEKSSTEIKSFFKNYQQPVCRKFYPAQLTDYKISDQKPTWFSKILVGGLLSFLFLQKAEAQTTYKFEKVIIPILPENEETRIEANLIKDSSDIQTITIKGKIISKDNIGGLQGANIILKGTQTGTTSNANGNFKLIFKRNFIDKEWILVISFVGFKTKEIKI